LSTATGNPGALGDEVVDGRDRQVAAAPDPPAATLAATPFMESSA